jgi:hypothetical protein
MPQVQLQALLERLNKAGAKLERLLTFTSDSAACMLLLGQMLASENKSFMKAQGESYTLK